MIPFVAGETVFLRKVAALWRMRGNFVANLYPEDGNVILLLEAPFPNMGLGSTQYSDSGPEYVLALTHLGIGFLRAGCIERMPT